MKKYLIFLFLLVSSFGFAQSVNDYSAVIVPLKYDFSSVENEYRLNTISKYNIQKAGFEAFYVTEMAEKVKGDKCDLLYMDVQKENGLLTTKVFVTLNDCNGKVVFQSGVGKSRDKNYGRAYQEALNEAFLSVYDLKYKYNNIGKGNYVQDKLTEAKVQGEDVNIEESVLVSSDLLVVEKIINGYLLLDSQSSKVVLKVYKTSDDNIFIGQSKTKNGVVIRKGEDAVFEYYENDKLVSEKLNVKL
jgi:SHS2 domain-containing protein